MTTNRGPGDPDDADQTDYSTWDTEDLKDQTMYGDNPEAFEELSQRCGFDCPDIDDEAFDKHDDYDD